MKPIVLVHGCPETAHVWDPLVRALAELGHEEVTRLSPPGFGASVPKGFAPTLAGYREWLVDAVRRLGTPVHLVGHDWGGGLTLLLAMDHPELLCSWASDALGVLHPDYVWHELARIWQAPDAGETWNAGHLARGPAERAVFLSERGIDDPEVARALADGFDARMGECILSLYRSARQPALAELGRGLERARARPGLAVLAEADDVVGSADERRESAARAGAEVVALPGLGHWWMAQAGGRAGAEALAAFWDAVERRR